MEPSKLQDIDFLDAHWDSSIDDLSLSQMCTDIQNDHEMSSIMDDITLSQALDRYEVDVKMDSLPDFADFNLIEMEITPDNVIGILENATHSSDDKRYSFVEDADIQNLLRTNESKNTRKNTNWSASTFNDWRGARIKATRCVIPELEAFTKADVNIWFSKFAVETRRKDGKPYPPKTLYMLFVGLLRFLREHGVHYNFLDEKNSEFYEFRRALSARMCELTTQGVGTTTKQAEPISAETENLLWEKGLLGNNSSESTINTMFFYNSKLFGLRGVDEHRALSVQQINVGADENGRFILFNGRANKTYRGGLNQRHISPKNIKHYCHNDLLYDIYRDYVGTIEKLGGDAFYRRPMKGKGFSVQSLGINKLGTIMKKMCSDCGLDGYYTNHSGKRTCATMLYQAGVPEQEIMARTGHRSVESVRKYKRPSREMLKDISNVLEPQGITKKVKCETISMPRDVEDMKVDPATATTSVFNGCVFNFSPQDN